MKQKLCAGSIILSLLLVSAPVISPQTDKLDRWEAVGNFVGREIGVKPVGKKTVFGVLRSADADRVRVDPGGGDPEVSITKSKVEKVWRARLKGSRRTGVGAAVGAATGGVAGLAVVYASRDSNDGQAGAAVPVLAILGAGIGAAAGFFVRKKNEKVLLIYERK